MHKYKLAQMLSTVPRSVSEKLLQSVFEKLCQAVDSPRSLTCWILFREKEYQQLVSLECHPDDYQCSERFADDYLVSKILSKFPDFKHPDLNPEKTAESSFKSFEEACEKTNKRFKEIDLDPSLWDPELHEVFLLARRKIRSVLGDPDLGRISSQFGWGPGATSVAKGNRTSAYVKFAKRPDVTSNCLIMGHCCINSIPSWVNCLLQTGEFPSVPISLTRDMMNVVRGNEVVFVPKNAKTHRIIAKEPHVNSFLQKGFGSEIRRLLRIRAGVNLKDQTLNQRLAKLGSVTGGLATIDLKGASDTISLELVRFLLPGNWFTLLDQIRSKQGFIPKDKTWIYYQKFSSMGNGCTFELESLIFWALCKSCLEIEGLDTTLSVYGDDLIVPVNSYGGIVKVLNFAGFTVNLEKSFSSGRFRESCGKDYFDGIDVRPYFIKGSISNVESLFKLANGIRRYSHRRSLYGCDKRFEESWQAVVKEIPAEFKDCKIPEGFGDIGLVVNFDEACPSKPRGGWDGYLFRAIIRLPVKEVMRDSHAGYTACLSALGSNHQTSPPLTCLLPCSPFGAKRAFEQFYKDGDYEGKLPLNGHHDLRDMTYPKMTRIHAFGWRELGPWNN